MYAFRNLFEKNPIQISAFVVAFVNFSILMDWINMTDKQVGGLNTVVVLGLGLFVASKTSNNRVLTELGDNAFEADPVVKEIRKAAASKKTPAKKAAVAKKTKARKVAAKEPAGV